MSEQADKALQEMLDISTDLDRALVYKGNEVLATNFSSDIQDAVVAKAHELENLGGQKAGEMGAGALTQLVVESRDGSVFLVQEGKDGGLGVLATGKTDSRIGLVFYDMKTCIRDTQEPVEQESGQGEEAE